MIEPWMAAASATAALAALTATTLACRWPHRPSLTGLTRPSQARTLGLALSAAVGLLAGLQLTPLAAASLALAGSALVYLALVDLRRFTLPAGGLAVLALAVALVLCLRPEDVLPHLATGGALLLLFATLQRIPSRGPPLLGGGDVVLAALVGALVGWRSAPLVFAVATMIPLAIQLVRGRRGPVPFGFWLCLAALPATAWAGIAAAGGG